MLIGGINFVSDSTIFLSDFRNALMMLFFVI